MTGAELKTLRESLGLSVQWLADRTGVGQRTVSYWETGKNAVPDDVSQLIGELDRALKRAVSEAVVQCRRLTETHGKPQDVVLRRYRGDANLWAGRPDMAGLPVAYHAAILTRVKDELQAAGFLVSIEFAQ